MPMLLSEVHCLTDFAPEPCLSKPIPLLSLTLFHYARILEACFKLQSTMESSRCQLQASALQCQQPPFPMLLGALSCHIKKQSFCREITWRERVESERPSDQVEERIIVDSKNK